MYDSKPARAASPVNSGGVNESKAILHMENAEQGKEYGIPFGFSLFCEYVRLEHVRIHVINRVNQVEYVMHIRVVAPQEYVNT